MRTQIVVLGGGYAGVMAANRLAGRDDLAVTLVNPRPRFVERVRLHQLAAGTHDAVQDYATVLSERVRLVVDEATRIEQAARSVVLAGGDALAYDHLVYAVGSSGGHDVPGVAEHALPVSGYEDASRLRAALADAPDAPVVVVGGGPTGVEAAAELAEVGRAVTLVCGGVLAPYVRAGARRAITRWLARLGVTVLVGPRAVAVGAEGVALDDGRVLPGLVVWAAGFRFPDLARRSGLTTDAAGRLLTDETLTSVDDPRIVGAGDAASPSGVPPRSSCQAAQPLGLHAAGTVLAHLDGRVGAPVGPVFVGQSIGLGRHAATVQVSRLDDTAIGLHVSGRPGGVVKEQVVRQTVANLVREARRPGSTPVPAARRTRARVLQGVTSPARPTRVGA